MTTPSHGEPATPYVRPHVCLSVQVRVQSAGGLPLGALPRPLVLTSLQKDHSHLKRCLLKWTYTYLLLNNFNYRLWGEAASGPPAVHTRCDSPACEVLGKTETRQAVTLTLTRARAD